MRQSYLKVSLHKLCALFGVTRQAFYDAEKNDIKISIAHMIILLIVKELRDDIPMLGTRKLMYRLKPQLENHGIKMGRDQLFDLLRFHGLLIRRRKRIAKTTDSFHWLKKYPNLTNNLVVIAAEQLWVSDITYIRTLEGFCYLSLITDAYSRKIVGYSLYPTLEALGCIEALLMAIDSLRKHLLTSFVLIHHSDRGIQYCSERYVEILRGNNIAISMTQSGSPYENALAERVNGIIKNEFFSKVVYQNYGQANRSIARIIQSYNGKRPHLSLGYLTPDEAHGLNGEIKKLWKPRRKPTPVSLETKIILND